MATCAMATAEFSERYYELAINLELIHDASGYFVPSQNEEAKLGYDIALVPALPRIWTSLTAGLRGVGSGGGEGVPRATSLFLQYKRPEFISNRNGKEAKDRDAILGESVPYYRFQLEQPQLGVLLDLQASCAGKAAVCYAAGIFHRREDFYAYKLASRVAEKSTFLRLDDIGRQLAGTGESAVSGQGGHCWTYDVHGGGGLLCSDPRPVAGSSFRSLRNLLREWAPRAESVESHVAEVTSQIREWRARSIEPVRDHLPTWPDIEVPMQYRLADIEEVSNAIRAQETLDELGIGWFLAVPARRRD
jgi:hypothetical protein